MTERRLLECCCACPAGLQGIVNRLAVDEAEVEERVFVEAITNQYESREAVKFAGVFVCEVWCAHSTGATFCGLVTALHAQWGCRQTSGDSGSFASALIVPAAESQRQPADLPPHLPAWLPSPFLIALQALWW
jgi:hypothetical protein